LNAYIGPVMAKYLGNLDRQLKASGYAQPLQITQCGGGPRSVRSRHVSRRSSRSTSGPVSGVTGSLYLTASSWGVRNIITTDMGGNLVRRRHHSRRQPEYSFVSNVVQ